MEKEEETKISNQSKVSIVILNWNGIEDTLDCLESLSKIDYEDYEVIVVDNGSSDDSVGLLRKVSGVKLVGNEANFGFSGGCNAGAKVAVGEYILFLNNDTVVEPNFLSGLVEVIKGDDEIGIVGPKIYCHSTCSYKERGCNIIWSAGVCVSCVTGHSKAIGANEVDDMQKYNVLKEVDALTGCCLLVRKDLYEKLGGFDEKFFAYFEDLKFCKVVKEFGYKIVYVPNSIIYHKVSLDKGGEGSFSSRYYDTRNQLQYIRDCVSPVFQPIAYLVCSLQLVSVAMYCYLKGGQKRNYAYVIVEGIQDFNNKKFGRQRHG